MIITAKSPQWGKGNWWPAINLSFLKLILWIWASLFNSLCRCGIVDILYLFEMILACSNLGEYLHRCPEEYTQLTELFNGSVNRFLVHFVHILWNCKALNPVLKEKKLFHFKWNFRVKKWCFSLCLGLVWISISKVMSLDKF